MTEDQREQLYHWAHAHLEGSLTAEEKVQMEAMILEDAEARRLFADLLHDHATLHWDHVGESPEEDITPFPESKVPTWNPLLTGLAASFILAVIAGLGWLVFQPATAPTFAMMESTKAAIWASGDLPTAQGERLGQGRLNLREGLATLHFDSGARVILEAPAQMELVNDMVCILQSGTVVADVPESAKGFRIDTPSAKVIDHGTRFVVNVEGSTGATKTQVFEGLVEVEHPKTRDVVWLEAGQRNFVAGDRLDPPSESPEEGTWAEPDFLLRRGPDWRVLTTGQRGGKDGYVQSVELQEHSSEVLLLVKNTDHPKGPIRKSYLGFDLRSVDRDRIVEAELILHFHPTGWGLASALPDSVFAVYGLTDKAQDDWSEASLTWENAPANPHKGGDLESGSVIKLGTFVLEQGVQRGKFGIDGQQLVDFLRTDPNALSTLIVIRETEEVEGGGLVHGFGSSRHPTLPPPTLAVRLAPQ